MANDPTIAIVGGGPGGLMLARLLHLRGIAATVFERDLNQTDRPQGGSLDLHADTGQRAIRLAQLEEAFAAEARPEDQGDRLYDEHGTLHFDRDGLGDNRPEIDRTALRRILLDCLPAETVRWASRIQTITPLPGGGFELNAPDAAERFDIVAGADGAWSRVRPLLSTATPVYEGVTLIELGFETSLHPAIGALVGSGKMFAVGNNRSLIGQRNGHGHIRGYAAFRVPEADAQGLAEASPCQVRARMLELFEGWAPGLTQMVEHGHIIGVRPMYALPVGHCWPTRPGLTLLGDAAHLMSPFSGEGVNLALADAADLAEALTSGNGWPAVETYETAMAARATPAAEGAASGLNTAVSSGGVSSVLAHYQERIAA